MRSAFCGILCVGALLGAAAGDTPPQPGWGIDAVLSGHVQRDEVEPYLELLGTSSIQWIRERGVGRADPEDQAPWKVDRWDTERRAVWRQIQAVGFRVVAFAGALKSVPREQPGNQLPENLLNVYRAARFLGRATVGEASAFEMVGEPDAHYCRDLPERVSAYQKAVYLGIKDGASERISESETAPGGRSLRSLRTGEAAQGSPLPIVLSGALAFPPGPWLDLAAANGIYEYTDAVNFHHYGFAEDLMGAIRAHREFGAKWSGRGELPVWITEVGLNNVSPDDWHNERARRQQAEFLVRCARIALDARVVVFMPFILAHRGDPFAMTESAERPFPAWDAYRDFTNEHAIPTNLPLVAASVAPSRVVLQWMPDNDTCIPFKVGGTYWFRDETPMRGTVWVYNFNDHPVSVRVRRHMGPAMRVNGSEEESEWTLNIAAMERAGLAVEISRDAEIEDAGEVRFSAVRDRRSTGISRLVFRVGERPGDHLASRSLEVLPRQARSFSYISGEFEKPQTVDRFQSLKGLNGVEIIEAGEPWSGAPISLMAAQAFPGPLHPPMLVMPVAGLPGRGESEFVRLRVENFMGDPVGTRVDLIDRHGQRFTIVENLGRLRDEPPGAVVWLRLRDFHPWVFGNTVPGARINPADIREVQLRFFGLSDAPELVTVDFQVRELETATGLEK